MFQIQNDDGTEEHGFMCEICTRLVIECSQHGDGKCQSPNIDLTLDHDDEEDKQE